MYDHFLDQNPRFQNIKFLLETFFSQFVLCLTSNNGTFQNIGGRMHGSSPHLKFCRTVPPKSPPVLYILQYVRNEVIRARECIRRVAHATKTSRTDNGDWLRGRP